jgi:hypothetical protein
MLISCQFCKDEYGDSINNVGSADNCACAYYKDVNLILSDFGSVFGLHPFSINDNSCVIFNNGLICDNCMSELIVTDQIRKEF